MLGFDFNNKNSFNDFGIKVEKRPVIPSPKRKISYIDIPGRDSSLWFDEESYEDITIPVECSVKGDDLINKIDDIKAWLYLAGESQLVFSFFSDKYFKAQVTSQIDFNQLYKKACRFIVIFRCRPFKYSVDNTPIVIEGYGRTISYTGRLFAKPTIKLFIEGSSGIFKINQTEIEFEGYDVSNIIIDSELMETYSIDDGEYINMNNLISGEYPKIEYGLNTIMFAGSITKIEIKVNKRWL